MLFDPWLQSLDQDEFRSTINNICEFSEQDHFSDSEPQRIVKVGVFI